MYSLQQQGQSPGMRGKPLQQDDLVDAVRQCQRNSNESCVCVCVSACMYVYVCVCVCVIDRDSDRDRGTRKRGSKSFKEKPELLSHSASHTYAHTYTHTHTHTLSRPIFLTVYTAAAPSCVSASLRSPPVLFRAVNGEESEGE